MKKILITTFIVCITHLTYAQQTVESIRKQATASAQQQDFTGAVQILEQGLQQYPDNIDLLKDEAYISYLGRDFQKSLDIGKKITSRDDADVQSYQILGLTYKAIADYKEADKMYKAALKKFPKSGVLYSEYGDMLTQYDNKHEAINQWEKGIQVDPNYSSNYYYAAKYYADEKNVFWSTIYSEIFVNIESLTKRSAEIKNLLLNNYKLILSGQSNINTLKTSGTDFEKAVASSMSVALEPTSSANIIPEMITAFRTRFILNWNSTAATSYPYHLFDFQSQLLREGIFDAYNQWLFGPVINKDRYDNWVYTHDAEMLDFTQFQHNVLFKMPPEQYYGH
ncbi:MAG TPA: tetratricopeptide repeat protein [Parafilimonas sp.]|nr:tetratricopeptide repeat protein [Parafilimonas sp.]